MKASTGALIWIVVIITFVICTGLSIRSVRKSLSEPKPKSPMQEQWEQQQMLKQAEIDQRQMMRDAKKAQKDAERQLRDSQRMLKSN